MIPGRVFKEYIFQLSPLRDLATKPHRFVGRDRVPGVHIHQHSCIFNDTTCLIHFHHNNILQHLAMSISSSTGWLLYTTRRPPTCNQSVEKYAWHSTVSLFKIIWVVMNIPYFLDSQHCKSCWRGCLVWDHWPVQFQRLKSAMNCCRINLNELTRQILSSMFHTGLTHWL